MLNILIKTLLIICFIRCLSPLWYILCCGI